MIRSKENLLEYQKIHKEAKAVINAQNTKDIMEETSLDTNIIIDSFMKREQDSNDDNLTDAVLKKLNNSSVTTNEL